MGNTTTQTSRDNQAAIIKAHGQKVSEGALQFPRFIAVSMGKPCCPSDKNGHITPGMAQAHGQDLAIENMQALPADMTQEDKLAKVAITVASKARFQCIKANPCTFGHKTQQQAEACSRGTQARTAKQAKNSIPVSTSLLSLEDLLKQTSSAQATQQAREEAKQAEATQATQQAPEATQQATQGKQATQAKQAKQGKLHSGSQGQASRA